MQTLIQHILPNEDIHLYIALIFQDFSFSISIIIPGVLNDVIEALKVYRPI